MRAKGAPILLAAVLGGAALAFPAAAVRHPLKRVVEKIEAAGDGAQRYHYRLVSSPSSRQRAMSFYVELASPVFDLRGGPTGEPSQADRPEGSP